MATFERRMDVTSYKTYAISRPKATHWRAASCEEVGCRLLERGFKTAVDESTQLGQRQAHYIRRESGRKYTEARREDGLTEFVFASGQPCFKEHKLPLDRQELFYVRGGDARGNPSGQVRRHSRPEDWVEDMAINQDRLRSAIERG
ncbi:hypothetical protein ACFWB2_14700 [Streptomyces virginiae]|uniref:hypothetical protein n=1 Tax=Streptomyces TaxID=1883 RepID=UPI00093BBDD8|nr:hypothetical protein [Streptomyces sp. MJM1172]OKI67569.1 hypothetical protein AMK15_06255 [Streptomyces sp. MJM1172]